MVSPYVQYAAERAGIPASKAEYRTSDYVYARQRTDAAWRELERIPPPIEPMWKSITGAALLVVFMVAACSLAAMIGG